MYYLFLEIQAEEMQKSGFLGVHVWIFPANRVKTRVPDKTNKQANRKKKKTTMEFQGCIIYFTKKVWKVASSIMGEDNF